MMQKSAWTFTEFTTHDVAYETASQLRHRLLRQPLGLDLFSEDRTAEALDRHFAAWSGEQMIACLVITGKSAKRVKLRQMCVAEDHQGRGAGSFLVASTEQVLRAGGIEEIELAARLEAQEFYRRLGYVATGEPFVEVTIDHILMTKTLT
ncbi:GNAT family N-acetyltransferase [Planctomycetaceae bacterium SH139]